MEYKMDKKEVASRLQEILNRNSERKVNKLIPEDIRQLNICIAALTIPVVVNCKHEDYTPCYGREGELMFKQCDTCGEEFD